MMLITYDVDTTVPAGAKRLRKVARACEKYGVRVQNSVFELLIDQTQYIDIKNKIERIIDKDKDSVRFYRLGNYWESKVETLGVNTTIQQGGTLIL